MEAQAESSREEALKYLDDMNKDGWVIRNTFDEKDPYFTAEKEGFMAHVNCRHKCGMLPRIYAWGPDEITIEPPFPYNWKEFQEAVFICEFCGKKAKETYRVAFANRSCADCLDIARNKLEKPGWCD